MANMFALILMLLTVITGIIWCFERFKLLPFRNNKSIRQNVRYEDVIHNPASCKVKRHFSRWLETSASVFPVLLLVFVVRSFFYEPFQIPSGSMMPTLLIGDFILVNKYAYGIKDPITQTTLIEIGHPKRGDVAVFKYPLKPTMDYIKRIIGLPGDRIIYDPVNKHVVVQPVCCNSHPVEKIMSVMYYNMRPSNFVQLFSLGGVNETKSGFYQIPLSGDVPRNGIRLREGEEALDNVTHFILNVPSAQDYVAAYYQQPGKPLAEWVVPAGHYFMMGDNRDNSSDSRYWGFVPEKNLVGKATAIWMSFEKQEGEWPSGIRLSHIGAIH